MYSPQDFDVVGKHFVKNLYVQTSVVGFKIKVISDCDDGKPLEDVILEDYLVVNTVNFVYVKQSDIIDTVLSKITKLRGCEVFVHMAHYPINWRSIINSSEITNINMSKVRIQEKVQFKQFIAKFTNATQILINMDTTEVTVPTCVGDWLNEWERTKPIRYFELHNVPLEISFSSIHKFYKDKCTKDAQVRIYIATTKGRAKTTSASVKKKFESFMKMRRLNPITAGFQVYFEKEFKVDDIRHYDHIISYVARQEQKQHLVPMVFRYLDNAILNKKNSILTNKS